MCVFAGFVNFEKDISQEKELLKAMNQTLSKREPDEEGYYIDKHVALAHKRLAAIDPKGRRTTYDGKFFFWKLCNCL